MVKLCLILDRVLDIFDLAVDDDDDDLADEDDSVRFRPSYWSGVDGLLFDGGGGIGLPLLSLFPMILNQCS